jgi:hypothetical protein
LQDGVEVLIFFEANMLIYGIGFETSGLYNLDKHITEVLVESFHHLGMLFVIPFWEAAF